MGTGATVLKALKMVGNWVQSNHVLALGVADKVVKFQADKKIDIIEDHLQTVDEKLNQLGEAALELDQKIDTEIELLKNQVHTMKIMLSVVGGVLGVAVVGIILLAVF